jgi:hypothetical protein
MEETNYFKVGKLLQELKEIEEITFIITTTSLHQTS